MPDLSKWFRANSAAREAAEATPVSWLSNVDGRSVTVDLRAAPREGARPAAAPEAQRGSEALDGDSCLQDVLDGADRWMQHQVEQLERAAVTMAADWAVRGLPNATAHIAEGRPLEPELVLSAQGAALYEQWSSHVKTGLQRGIDAATTRASESLSKLRTSVARVEALGSDVASVKRELRDLESGQREGELAAGGAWLGALGYWVLASLIGLCELFAQFPTISLYLSRDGALADVSRSMAEDAVSGGSLAGVKLLVTNLMLHLDATLVTCGVVLLIVLMSKALGASLRELVSPAGTPASLTARVSRRHNAVLSLAAVAGLCCILAFLFDARSTIGELSRARVAIAERELQAARQTTGEARGGDISQMVAVMRREQDARHTLTTLQAEQAYSESVGRINLGTTLLNLGLIFGALVLGFARRPGSSPERERRMMRDSLRASLEALLRDVTAARHSAEECAAAARTAVGQARQLLSWDATGEYGAKAQRLRGVLSVWRTENLRMRALDASSVAAFHVAPPFHLPAIEPRAPQASLPVLDEQQRTLDALCVELSCEVPNDSFPRLEAA